MSPAAPAIMPPSRNVSEIVVSTLMPMRRAASGSCAVARIALPRRLRETKAAGRITSGTVTRDREHVRGGMLDPERRRRGCFWA